MVTHDASCFGCGELATDVLAASRAVCFCGVPVPCPACEGDGCRHCGPDEEDAERIAVLLEGQRDPGDRYDDARAEGGR